MQKVRIQWNELPLRARPLSASDISKVFGGCNGDGTRCSSSKDCCSGCCTYQSTWGTMNYLHCQAPGTVPRGKQ
jgi:hypothetical protein